MTGQQSTNLKSKTTAQEFEKELSREEQELLREIFRALRVIRYGSVVVTVHDGHVVEIQKTERVRRDPGRQAV
jgi:hypothetical protein